MYGPDDTTRSLYVDGLALSNFSAYSFGIGVVTGMIRNAAKPGPCACVSLNVIWFGLSTTMPGMSWSLPGFFGKPSMKLKYVVYWFGTLAVAARSKAYFTSFASMSRLTGGPNLTPFFSFTVTDFLSSAIWGSPSARPGTA